MKTFFVACLAIVSAVCSNSSTSAAETGDLKIRFVFEGKAPAPEKIDVNRDAEFCGKFGLEDETLIVNPVNQGIKNVVVAVYTGRGGSKLPKMPEGDTTHTLANENCRFEPHVIVAQAGDKLKVTNPDIVSHNANLQFFDNKPENFTIPAGQEKTVDLPKPEPGMVTVACNIHPWMTAKLMVLDHPFGAVSNEDGDLIIKGLPVGEELTFRANHEAGSIKEVIVDGKKTEWKRSRFEIKIKAGMNDMGVVTIPKDFVN